MQKHLKLISFLLAGMLAMSMGGCSLSGKNDSESSTSEGDTNEEKNDESDDSKDEKKKTKEDIRPQDDFYDYVNFDTLAALDIPYGEISVSGFDSKEFEDSVNDIVKEIGKSGKKYPAGSNEQLICDYYNQVLDYKDDGSVEKEIMGNCDRILAAKDISELFDIWGDLEKNYGAESVFRFSVGRDYRDGSEYCLSLYPMDRFFDVALKDIKELSSKCKSANNIARDMHRVMGDDFETANEKGRQMAYLGIDIANATNTDELSQVELLMNTEKTSFDELDSILSNLNGSVTDIFIGSDVKSATDGVYIYDKGQLEAINELITDENLEKWRTYVFASYLYSFGGYIRESNDILRDYNPESKEAEDKTAAAEVRRLLEDRLGEIFAERYYTPELDRAMNKMFGQIIDSYDELIKGADWLSSETRNALLKKLHNIILITAPEPHKTDAADAKLIGRNKYETYKNCAMKFNSESTDKLKRKVDRNEADMSATTINAQYLPCNSINVTVAIMQKPMFDPKASDAENLGRLGAAMAHEIGHAFDSNCINFNPDGKYDPNWINEADKKVLDERADKLAEYYSKFTVMEVYHVKGEKTNGENYADLGAVECITNIIDGETELKTMFENYAKSWCTLMVDTYGIDALMTDEHSPAKVRVNAVLASNSKFNEVYDLKEGDGMYFPPEERVSRW